MLSKYIIYITAQVDKQLILPFIAHNSFHSVRKHEWCPLPLYPIFALKIPQYVPEVDMEEMARRGHHKVVVVPVSQAEDVGGDTVCSARNHEVTHLFIVQV